MSRRIIFVLAFASGLIIYTHSSFAQAEKAIFSIRSFNSDSIQLAQSTGFFMVGNHGYSYASCFRNAAHAVAILHDGKEHRISKINGYDPTTGMTRFELEEILSTNISKLKKKNTMSSVGTGVRILYATSDDRVQSESRIIKKKDALIGYGEAVLVEGALGNHLFGSPVVNTLGEIEGIVVSGDSSDEFGFISNISNVDNLKSASKSVAEFGKDLRNLNYLIQGINGYMLENLNEAISAFGKAKSTRPNHVTAFYYLGLLNYQLDRISAARTNMSKAIELNTNLPLAYYLRGLINYGNEDFNNAIQDFDQAESLEIENLDLYEKRGKAKYETKEYEDAIADFEKAESMGSQDGEMYYFLGNTRFRKDDYHGAIQSYNKAIDLGEKSETIYNKRGEAKHNLKNLDGAISDYSLAIKVNPEYEKAYVNQGTAYFEKGENSKALTSLTMAKDMGATSAELFTML